MTGRLAHIGLDANQLGFVIRLRVHASRMGQPTGTEATERIIVMSYEFLVDSNAALPGWPKRMQSDEIHQLVEVISESDTSVLLRWQGTETRPRWPEDITISREPKGLLVSFHSSTGEQRELFMDALARSLMSDGVLPRVIEL